jgi:hypothetical protein
MQVIKIWLTLLLMLPLTEGLLYSQVLISSSNGTPDPSAMLEIQSSNKGLLIPRLKTADRQSISNPAPGLLVFDSELNSFFLYGKGKWNDLSTSSEIWSQNSTSVYLSNSNLNLGVGTFNPTGKFVIKADPLKNPNDPLFEIQDETGEPIFVVTSEGARVYVKEFGVKGTSGGFAVGRYGIAKDKGAGDLFFVDHDSTRVYTDGGAKGASGGFAVGRYGIAKDKTGFYFYTGIDSTRVYATDAMKGASGGFAVGRYGIAKGIETYSFYTAKDSTRVYSDPNVKGSAGGFAVGRYGIAKNSSDYFTHITHNNAFIGYSAGYNTTSGVDNIFIGKNAGIQNTLGSNNVYIGNYTGSNALGSNATGNLFIGNQAGSAETGSNKLYINNGLSDPNTALIYGDFASGSERVYLNGNLRFNRGLNTISMPTFRGNSNEVLIMGPGGTTDWENVNNLVTIPPSYQAPTIEITFDGGFAFDDGDNIGTLIVKTDGVEGMRVDLPLVEKNIGRIIRVKNARKQGVVLVFPQATDAIENVKTPPLSAEPGETYSFQAGIDKQSGETVWFIVDYTSESLENVSSGIIKVTSTDYDFNTEPDGPRVSTLILSQGNQQVLLPKSTLYPNRTLIIKNALEGKSYINAEGSDNIDGVSSISLNSGRESYTMQTDGNGNWYILNHYMP